MPRAARPPSNFTSDNHVLYAGWVLSNLARSGLPVEPVRDADGNYTNRVHIRLNFGGDYPPVLTLLIPPPPDDWDLFNPSKPDDGPTFRGAEGAPEA